MDDPRLPEAPEMHLMGWWSWVLSLVGVTGVLLAGSRNKWGWALGLAIQPVWVVYAIVTEQYGFLVSAAVYGSAYARNFVKWWREKPTVEPG